MPGTYFEVFEYRTIFLCAYKYNSSTSSTSRFIIRHFVFFSVSLLSAVTTEFVSLLSKM